MDHLLFVTPLKVMLEYCYLKCYIHFFNIPTFTDFFDKIFLTLNNPPSLSPLPRITQLTALLTSKQIKQSGSI
jgi:hypothetical protein